MEERDKLRLQLGEGAPEGLLTLLLEDAGEAVRRMTGQEDLSQLSAGVRAVALCLYNKMGREGEGSYAAGGVSISYQELPEAVKGLLPLPLATVAGRGLSHVAPQP